MINIKTVEILKKQGFEMKDIMKAVNAAEANGQAELNGWVIRYNDRGEMIVLHPSYCGIWTGDYRSHVIFQKNISCSYAGFYIQSKYRDIEKVLEKAAEHKTNDFVLCECHAGDYQRRKKQVEKLGYTVYKTNISECKSEISTCLFLIA